MLWIILEFDDVITFVVAAHEVGLRTPAHSADMLYSEHHSEVMLSTAGLHRKEIFLAGVKIVAPGLTRAQNATFPRRPHGSGSDFEKQN